MKPTLILITALLLAPPSALRAESPVPSRFISPWTWPERPPAYLVFGDLNATYPQQYYAVDASLEMVIQCEFPKLRYFSLIAYDAADVAIASLHDEQIAPDAGSVNPFRPGADWKAPNRHYTAIVRFTPPPADQSAKAGFHGTQGARGNVLYVGLRADGKPNTGGRIAYRRYLPSEGEDLSGGVKNPTVWYRKVADGSPVEPRQLGKRDVFDMSSIRRGRGSGASPVLRKQPAQASPGGGALRWRRSTQSPTLGENPETVYIGAAIQTDPAQLLVIRWKCPSFPDTFHHHGITGREQLRYWSMTFATRMTKSVFTLADCQASMGRDGYVNLVVGFGAPRPARATAENGYTWVDLKDEPVTTLVYRNLMPSSGFKNSAAAVPPGQLVGDQMGEFLPVGRYFTPEQFAALDLPGMK